MSVHPAYKIVDVSSTSMEAMHPTYDFLYQFWCHHQQCVCYYCQQYQQYPTQEFFPPQQPNIHVKDNPKLLISMHPSLVATEAPEQPEQPESSNQEFVCSKCKKEFKVKKWYQKHLVSCLVTHTCPTCGKVFDSARKLGHHKRNVHSTELFPCEHCNKVFKCKASLKMHTRRIHTAPSDCYTCSQCESTFGCVQSLRRHMARHALSSAQWSCGFCSLVFHNSYNLKRHHLMQHVRKTFRCRDCHLIFEHLNDWWNHLHTKHRQKKYVCSECPMSFNRYSNKQRHMSVHTSQRNFHCNLCDKSFKMKKSLEFHQTHRHTRLRPFGCTQCGKRFSRRSTLTTHSLLHKPKSYGCKLDDCDRTFHTQYRLACHVATRHHEHFVQARRLHVASAREKYRMMRQFYQSGEETSTTGFYGCL